MNRPADVVATTGTAPPSRAQTYKDVVSEAVKDVVSEAMIGAAQVIESMYGKSGVLVTLVARYPGDVERDLVITFDSELLAVVDVLVRRKRVELEADRAGQGS